MTLPPTILTQFRATRPRYQLPQERILAWLSAAHAAADAAADRLDDAERSALEERLARVLARCACRPDKIAMRGVSIADVDHADWSDNVLYDIPRMPHGGSTAVRTQLFAEIVDAYFETAYADEVIPPDDLVHVTCTGYVSPSGGQKLVARRGWGAITRITHAYQMGCYAAAPAIRIAAGLLATRTQAISRRVDIVHTELCSLHLDPSDHRIEQLVVQSLFADGLIRYSVVSDPGAPGLRVRAIHECVLPDSADAMSWTVGDHGMHMTLSRDVPDRIAGALRGFVLDLYAQAGLGLANLRTSTFAVHPGGPKIIDRVREMLELDEAQVATSRAVLFDHGNMSSATLPHIWQRLLEDPAVPRGTVIPSLAFGPGLTVCGVLLEKQ